MLRNVCRCLDGHLERVLRKSRGDDVGLDIVRPDPVPQVADASLDPLELLHAPPYDGTLLAAGACRAISTPARTTSKSKGRSEPWFAITSLSSRAQAIRVPARSRMLRPFQ